MTLILPEGRYRARAVQVRGENDEMVWTRIGVAGTGTECFEVLFAITEGEHKDREILWKGWLGQSEKGIKRTMQAMHMLGATSNDVRQVLKDKLDTEVEIVVEHETYKGITTAKVAYVNPGGDVAMDKLADRVLVVMAGKGRKKTEVKQPDLSFPPEDDIPW